MLGRSTVVSKRAMIDLTIKTAYAIIGLLLLVRIINPARAEVYIAGTEPFIRSLFFWTRKDK